MRNHGTCTYCQEPAESVVALKLQVDRHPDDPEKVKLRIVTGSKRPEGHDYIGDDRPSADTPHTPACREHTVLLFRAGLNGDGDAMETLYKDMHTKIDALMREIG